MASSILFITLLISLSSISLQLVFAQVPGTTTATCSSMLLSLAPCGPFVQGFVQLPAQPCCDGLNQIYSQQPTCLCLFLNNTSTLSPAFPINQTLALQLPPLCNVPANASSCSSPGGEAPSDSSSVAPPPSSSTSSPVSPSAKNNSSVAGTPVAQLAPRPTSLMGLGYDLRSSGSKSKIQLIILALAVILPGTLFI
ncbi:protein YLS3 [Brassica rapa]|uniref:Bifunctional inhibitor/plant lipid transfer protein/seed storage helical domain-containing protein n=1 Tax=Brassica campestris TaxID=3711 RepID=M4DHH8_BRACM|nr:protein YLS3 [Brassica rapa]